MWKYLAMTVDHSPSAGAEPLPADWIRERLSPPEAGLVSSWVPGGFESYLRILHPVQLPRDRDPLVRWADVSTWSGVALHPTVQWPEVALPQVDPPTDPPWRSQGPRQGSLYLPDAEALIEDLAPYTPTALARYFCVWSGWGRGATVRDPSGSGEVPIARRSQRSRIVELPWREYELFEGSLASAISFELSNGNCFQSPNLWWPSDHSWCVASEIDLPWTYVGGSKELIGHLLADERLETVLCAPSDPLWTDLPTWLLDRIEAAVDEVLRSGSVVLTFAAGTVDVSLQSLDKRGQAVIIARSTRPSGWAGANTPVNTRRPEALRGEVRTRVHAAVRALVEV